ncbi:type III-B CRISPR-associated protein Cas10/Cmr2 [Tumidithrix elongata RA019]|uniref:Type III-B CRISPR-associated protein Cas10/Cmr2 n=1 Tax=Tumidithrix elongata BACA0141 TaxID=2716417 RepID=A0AAW9Q3A1_9CYAN|nr:type III-B CRISPR-associated protein Cas10/Cmr2 [Tumidithrix elongata RA019]
MPEKLLTNREGSDASSTACIYTAISFAPVQGFIEKSRKLRDLYGASQILSYLSYRIVEAAKRLEGITVISPAIREGELSIDLIQGMPNRILIVGAINHDRAFNLFRDTLNDAWGKIIKACKDWVEREITNDDINHKYNWNSYDWNMSWKRWEMHAWEIFVGQNNSKDDQNNPIHSAMRDLETRKLRRAWTVPNWNGESSSLSGHDAIAYPNMDREITKENKRNAGRERDEIVDFYQSLAAALENSKQQDEPKYLDPSEKLSIPELIKRLVTHHQVSTLVDRIATENRIIRRGDPRPVFRIDNFSELLRKDDESGETYWTGWFMGDGDEVGKHLKELSDLPSPHDAEAVTEFSAKLRNSGSSFQDGFERKRRGRVVYAGGDDFFGVMYSHKKGIHLNGADAIDWLIDLNKDWKSNNLGINLSVGFVWAGHSVPQRDVLQHCREAEKRAKNLGHDRITIRIIFNNGQFVQWTTPWECLKWLKDYRDRDGTQTYFKNKETGNYELTGKKANWSHVYGDLAQLKARHAIPPKNPKPKNEDIAIELLNLYFGNDKGTNLSDNREKITGGSDTKSVIEWIENMIRVGWQLC